MHHPTDRITLTKAFVTPVAEHWLEREIAQWVYGGSVLVCAGVCGQERTPLATVNGNLTAPRYVDDILRPTVLPFIQQQSRGVIYQHGNARSHLAWIVHNLNEGNDVVLPWPECSPNIHADIPTGMATCYYPT